MIGYYMHWLILFEIIYILGAVICSAALPLYLSKMRDNMDNDPNFIANVYRPTWGGIIEGMVLGLIPLVNVVLSIVCIRHMIQEMRIEGNRGS